jgi:O-antigen/teichoic acid export membrane protein
MARDASPADPNRYIRTDPMRLDLRRRSLRAGVVTVGAQAVLGAIAVLSTMVLARVLTPADFGLLAMVFSLTAFAATFRDLGLPMAMLHRETLDEREASAAFWMNVRWSVAVTLAVAALAPVLAWFYGEPSLVAITPVLAATMLCAGLGDQHEALLKRDLRFAAVTAIEVGSALFAAGAGIAGAVLGAGYWALVIQVAAFRVARTAALWAVCGWRPAGYRRRLPLSDSGVRALLSYGLPYSGSSVVSHVGSHLDQALVGYFGGASSLGLYSSALRWSQFPFRQIQTPLLGVAVASLSRVQHDSQAYRASARLGLLPVFAVSLPTLAFLFVEARSAIHFLLGDQWLEAVPMFRILCVAAFTVSVTRVTKWLYLAEGTTRRGLAWGLISAPITILAVSLGAHWGVLGVAAGYATAVILLAYPSVSFCLKTSAISVRDYFGVAARPALASVVAGGVLALAYGLFFGGAGSVFLALLAKAAIFCSAFVLCWLVTPGGRRDARSLLALVPELWSAKSRTHAAPAGASSNA